MRAETDLQRHAADKVKRTLNDVIDLVSDPAERARIALMASSVCIGTAAANLSVAAATRGETLSKRDSTLAVLDLLRHETRRHDARDHCQGREG